MVGSLGSSYSMASFSGWIMRQLLFDSWYGWDCLDRWDGWRAGWMGGKLASCWLDGWISTLFAKGKCL